MGRDCVWESGRTDQDYGSGQVVISLRLASSISSAPITEDPRFPPHLGLGSDLGLRDLGFRDLGFRELGFRDLGFRDLGCIWFSVLKA